MTRYDRVIPPGGRGKITLSIDSRRVSGPFNKRSVVWSDDPQKPSVALYLKGTVEPLVLLEPGGYLGLWGVIGKTPPAKLKILNNNPRPLKITGIDSDLSGHIRWDLKEIEAGNVYQLEVEDISPQAGEYSGHLFIRTDHPQKPEMVIIIQGGIVEKWSILEEISKHYRRSKCQRLGKPIEFAALVRQIVENPMLNGATIRLDVALRLAAK